MYGAAQVGSLAPGSCARVVRLGRSAHFAEEASAHAPRAPAPTRGGGKAARL